MGSSKHTVVIEAQVQTTLNGMQEAVNKLQRGLKEGTTKVDLTKSIGAALSKDIAKFQKDYEKITKLISNGELELGDSKEFASRAKHIISTFEEIQRVVGNFESMELIDARKLFPSAFDSKVKELKSTLSGLSESFDKISSKGLESSKLEGDLKSLEKEVEDLRTKAGNVGQLKIDNDQAQTRLEEANQAIDEIRRKLKETYKAKIEVELPAKEKEIQDKIDEINKKKSKRATTKEIVDREGRVTTYKGKSRAAWERDTKSSSQQRNAALKVLDAYEKEKQQLKELEAQLEQVRKARKTLGETYPKLDNADLGEAASKVGQGTAEIDAITDALKKQADAAEEASEAQKKYNEAQTASKKLEGKEAELNKTRTKLAEVRQEIENLSKKTDFSSIQRAVEELNKSLDDADKIDIDLSPEMLKSEDGVKQLMKALNKLDDKKLEELKEALKGIGLNSEDAKSGLDAFGDSVNKVNEGARSLTRAEQDIERLKDQVLDFFSISNTVQIFKNAVRDAFETVKELDAVMTETAVVTDFSIGDMWDKLPEYSDEANKLGTSIASLYEATTLYYQQGLNSAQAMDVGIETMKMARIANMDAAAATEAMTAALRGFNMEINETSATRINDVYSELAAITAADTEQIATAMSKTASIAASANMEFETTAALLAQIIETTQEAPETAGTAMKTIIARFTEVKELFDEGMLTGKDSEGEEININKIDAALKKVGISLSDFLRGEKGIDEIFLELASKWDSLDLATQRYIATTAAGSRQQSRFLAMMSNYGRTMELVTAANNSAGASQQQFDKTLESLDAKLQRLKNAWAEFTMGLANNDLIKGAVDLLTEILEKLNQFSDFGSDGIGGVVTMLTRLATVIMGLKGGKAVIEGLLKTFISGKTAFGKQMLEGLGGMGLGKALATEGWIKMGVLDALSEQGAQAEEILDNVKVGFLKAGDGAKLFGKKLLALSPYIAILIAIGAAVYGIVKSFKAAQSEAKLDNINQALADLNTEAQNAQDELGEIGSARTELNGLQDTLNGLTKGTAEWKSALVDVNRQVLELIEKYPSLEYELGADGALSIKQESWDNLLAQQQKVITNMAAQRLDLESQRANIVKDIDFEKFVVDSYGTNTAEVDRAAKRANRKALRKNKDYQTARWQDAAMAASGAQVEETEQDKVRKSLEGYLAEEQVMGQTKFERWMAQAEMDMAQWYQNSPLLAWLADGANAASGNVYIGESETAKRQRLLNENENYYVDEVAEKLVGLNQTEMTALAAEFAREGENSQTVTESNFIKMLETATGRKWALENGEASEEAKKLMQAIKDFDKATNSFNDLIQTEIENQSSQESLTRQFTMNALTGSPIMEKDYADSIVNVISKGEKEAISAQVNAKASELEASYKDENGNWKNLEELATEYARINGFQAVGQEVYRDGTYSEKVDTSPEAMIRALATEAITVEIKEKAEKTAGAIGKEKEQEKLFDNLFSTDGQEITGEQLSKYSTDKGTLDFNAIARDMGHVAEFGSDAFQVMVREMEQTPEDLRKILESNFKAANERTKKQRLTTANSIAEYSAGSSLTKDEIYAGVAEAEKQMQGELTDIEVRGILDSAIQALSSTGDSQLAQTGIFKLLSEGIEGNAEKFKALSDVITGINWNDPVEASSQIQKHLNSSNTTAREFAQEMMALNSTFLGDASQLQAFFNSSEYEDIASKIAEIREVQDKVTGADVEELASEYSYLNKMLKNTKMTSEGLAAILNQVSDGALGFEEINDVILAGIKNLGSFGASLDKILVYLREFEPGRDEGEAQDFIDNASEIVNDRVKNLEYGNTEAKGYITELLGKSYLQGDTQQQIAAMDAAAKWLESISGSPGAGMQVFKNIAEGKDIMGNIIAGGQQKPEGINFGYGADGKFFMDIDAQKYGTLEEVTAAFSESNLGGTKTLWDTMFTLLSNFDPAFMQEWEMEQAALAPQRMREEALKVDDKAIVSQKSIDATAQAMYDALGESTGKSLEDFKKEITKGLGEYEIFDVFNADGTRKELEQLKKDIEGLFGGGESGRTGLLSNYLIGEEGNQFIDFTSLTKGLETFGLTTQEAFSAALDYVSDLPAQLESVKSIMINGQEISLVDANGTKKDLEVVKEEIASVKTAAEEGNTEMQVSTAAATQKIRSYKAEITSVPRNWNTHFTTSGTTTPPTSGGGSTGGGPVIATNTRLAEGTKNHPKSELSLTGEEGPELVYGKDGAYIVGLEGPQMAQINRGDTVFTAEETEEIYRRKGVSVNNYAPGKDGITTGILDLDKIVSSGSGGRSGGSSKDDDEETWENPLDKLYNLLHKIDEELRQRERIERRYEKLLESLDVSANKIVAVNREELAQLERERMLQEQLIEGREHQIQKYQEENSDLQQYARVMENERGEKVLRIDWDRINAVTDTEKGDRIEAYVSQLEEWFDDLEGAEDALWDIEDAVAEIKERGKQQYEELEDKIKDAVVQTYQEQIDKLSQINDSINDTNTELLDAIQESIDKSRQERDNRKTEKELAEKQRRLLYLQQDTSGANALEIMQLQKEIEEGQEDYTDTLIDQKISELQKQNDDAAKQREKQITLMQAQLDQYIESGEIWTEVYSLIEEGLSGDNGLIRGSRLEEILKNADNYSGLSAIGQQSWWVEMNQMIAEALAYLETGRQLEDLGIKNQDIEMVLPDGKVVKGRVDENGNVTAEDGAVYNNVWQGADGRYYAGENFSKPEEPVVEDFSDESMPEDNTVKKNIKNNFNVRREANLKASIIKTLTKGTEIEIDGYKEDWYHIIKPLQGFIHKNAITSSIDKAQLKAYKTGGLADFTGPAWLDGSKSRPEIVLNSQDSRNFVQLRDILSSVLNRGNISTSTENSGDITYDIDINVENIGNDYDVEQVANKVKSLINEDARYRNNNAVSLKR